MTAILKQSYQILPYFQFGFGQADGGVAAGNDSATFLIRGFDDATGTPYIYLKGVSDELVLSTMPAPIQQYGSYAVQWNKLNLAVRVEAVSGNDVTVGFYMQAPWLIHAPADGPTWHRVTEQTITVADIATSKFVWRYYSNNSKTQTFRWTEARFCKDPSGILLGLPESTGARKALSIRPATTNTVVDAPTVRIASTGTDLVLHHDGTGDPSTAANGHYILLSKAATANRFTVGATLFDSTGQTYCYHNASMYASGDTVLAIANKLNAPAPSTDYNYDIVGKISTDGGASWGDEFTIIEYADGGTKGVVIGPHCLMRTSGGTWLIAACDVTASSNDFALRLLATSSAVPNTGWVKINTTAILGNEFSIAENGSTLYLAIRQTVSAGIAFAGLTKSTDGGVTWTKPFSGGAGLDTCNGAGSTPLIPAGGQPINLLFDGGKAYFFHPQRFVVSGTLARFQIQCTVADNIDSAITYGPHPMSPVYGYPNYGRCSYWCLRSDRQGGLIGTASRRAGGADWISIPNFFGARKTV